jgi:succinate dehydrogenase / fumarate reductase membrane anchor subunit
MSLRTPLARVRGLGAAKEGVTHWWMQRVTALALIPLTVWFAYSMAMLGKMDHETLVAWIRSPAVTVLLILLIVVGPYHMQLGLKVILEDYIHSGWLKLSAIIAMNFMTVALMVAGVLAVLRIALEAL